MHNYAMGGLALTIVPTDLGSDTVAELVGQTLLVNPAAAVEDQLAAIADTTVHLATGRLAWGRRVRHLQAVAA